MRHCRRMGAGHWHFAIAIVEQKAAEHRGIDVEIVALQPLLIAISQRLAALNIGSFSGSSISVRARLLSLVGLVPDQSRRCVSRRSFTI